MIHYRYKSRDWWITFALQIIASAVAVAMILLCSCRSHKEYTSSESISMSASADSVSNMVSEKESLKLSVASEAALTFDSISITQAVCCPSESESKTPKEKVIRIYGGSLAHAIIAKSSVLSKKDSTSTEVAKNNSSEKEKEKKSVSENKDKSGWFVAGVFVFICAVFLILQISKKDVS